MKRHLYEIVSVLDNIYVEKKTSSVQSITRDLRNSRLFETASIGTQLVENFGKISKVTNHVVGPDGMSFESQFPVAQANETQDEFEARVINFLKVVINDILIFAVVGPQLSDELHKKVFSGDFKPPEGVLTMLTKNIRELSSEKKVLCNVRKQSVPVCIEEETVYEVTIMRVQTSLVRQLKHISLGLEADRVETLVVVVLLAWSSFQGQRRVNDHDKF